MWFKSNLYIILIENNKDISILDCFDSDNILKCYVYDLINLHITKENYLKLIELCDFLMIENVDILIDKIVDYFDVSIIHNFSNFYKYNTKRLKLFDKSTLEEAISLYIKDEKLCFQTYGFSAYWDVSKIYDMTKIFYKSVFNGDISHTTLFKGSTL